MKKITLTKNGESVEVVENGAYLIDGVSYTVEVDNTNGVVSVSRMCDTEIKTKIDDENVAILSTSNSLINDDDRTLPRIEKWYSFTGSEFSWDSATYNFSNDGYLYYEKDTDCHKCVKDDILKTSQFININSINSMSVNTDINVREQTISRIKDKYYAHTEALNENGLKLGTLHIYLNGELGYFSYNIKGYFNNSNIDGVSDKNTFYLDATYNVDGYFQAELIKMVKEKDELTDFSVYYPKIVSSNSTYTYEKSNPNTFRILETVSDTSRLASSFISSSLSDFTASIQSIILSKYFVNSKFFNFLFLDNLGKDKYRVSLTISDDRKGTLEIISAISYYRQYIENTYNEEMLSELTTICEAINLLNDDYDYDAISYIDENDVLVELPLYYSKFLSENNMLENGLFYGYKSNIDFEFEKIIVPRSLSFMIKSKNLFNGVDIEINKEDARYNETSNDLLIDSRYPTGGYDVQLINKNILTTLANDVNIKTTYNLLDEIYLLLLEEEENINVISDGTRTLKKDDYLIDNTYNGEWKWDFYTELTDNQAKIVSGLQVPTIVCNIPIRASSINGVLIDVVVRGANYLNKSVKNYSGNIFGNERTIKPLYDYDEEKQKEFSDFVNNTFLSPNNLLQEEKYPAFYKNLETYNGEPLTGLIDKYNANLLPFYNVFAGSGYTEDMKRNKVPLISDRDRIDTNFEEYSENFYVDDKSKLSSLKDAMIYIEDTLKCFSMEFYGTYGIIEDIEKLKTINIFKVSNLVMEPSNVREELFYEGIYLSVNDTIPSSVTKYTDYYEPVTISQTVEKLGSFKIDNNNGFYSFSGTELDLKSTPIIRWRYGYGEDGKRLLINEGIDESFCNNFYKETSTKKEEVIYNIVKNSDGSVEITWNNRSGIDAKFFTINDQKVLIPTGGN